MRNKTMKKLNIFITTTVLAIPVAADTVNSRFEVAARYAREAMLEERNARDSYSDCCSNSNCCCSTSESTPDNTYNSGGGSSYHNNSDGGSSYHGNGGSPRRGWAR